MKLLLLFTLVACVVYLTESKALVCYYSSKAVYRPEPFKYEVEDNDPFLCTHLNYAFAGLGEDFTIKVLDPRNDLCDDGGKCGFDRFTRLKEQNPELKTLLSVGGASEESSRYSMMAEDPATRKIFIDSTLKLLKEHKFDGIDLDWEYPTKKGGSPDDYVNFVTLLREFSEALHPEGMILTAAVSAGKNTIDPAYDVPGMSKYLDLINLMTYNFHGNWEKYTHHRSILYAHPKDEGRALTLNQDYAVNYWIEKGAPKEKLVLGLPFHAHTYTLDSAAETGIYAPASNPGPSEGGYNQICASQMTEDWTIVHEPDMNEPYGYYGLNWFAYEDSISLGIKAKYAVDKGLAGCMVWSIDADDFHGTCYGKPRPLLNAINDALNL
ncbi:acidic mammalian chitinase-like [Palaemon carinicauda]|uniref:acidic mammalian chitinase-like n=1 Tax=Palaemon carinicauda TaxID=392227 RepID=UPI0035B69627